MTVWPHPGKKNSLTVANIRVGRRRQGGTGKNIRTKGIGENIFNRRRKGQGRNPVVAIDSPGCPDLEEADGIDVEEILVGKDPTRRK